LPVALISLKHTMWPERLPSEDSLLSPLTTASHHFPGFPGLAEEDGVPGRGFLFQ
jgi:hypothetical protein